MNNHEADSRNNFATLVEVLRFRAVHQPEQRAYTYLIDGETEGGHLTFAELDLQARTVAAMLQHGCHRFSGPTSPFRWFVGLNIDYPVWDVTVFTKNRERLLARWRRSRLQGSSF